MPKVYLPENWGALSADGNIVGQNVTLDFNKDGNGSILNTGDIAASDTLTVNTNTLTNRANQVDVGQIWQYLQATGYEDTTGTTVQPGGFMSAANMNLNVQTLNQIGGALQTLNSDGTINQSGTQQLITALQQQLGGNFTQTSLSDNLHTSFTAQGGFGFSDIAMIAFEVVVSIMTAGAASIEIGATLGAEGGTFAAATASAGLGNAVLSAAIAGFTTSAVSQLAATGRLNFGSAFEAAGIAAITAGLTNGINYNSTTGVGFSTQPLPIGGPTSSLAMLSGVQAVGGAMVPQAGSAAATSLPEELLALGANAAISAGVQTAIGGGSLLGNLEHDAVSDLAAAGAYAIGQAAPGLRADLGDVGGEVAYIGLHGALGGAESAAEGTGCAGGAIGGAASAAFSPDLLKAIDPTGADLNPGQQAAMAGFATLLGGGLAGLAGANAQGGAIAAQNEVLNNDTASQAHIADALKSGGFAAAALSALYTVMPWLPGNPMVQVAGSTATSIAQGVVGQIPPHNGGSPPSTGAAPVTICDPPFCEVVPAPPGMPGDAHLSKGGDNGESELEGGSGARATNQGPTASTSGDAARQVGQTRETTVANIVNGSTSGEQVAVPGLGSTDIDVVAANGDLVAVGGPAKANNLGKLGQELRIYQAIAAQRGVSAQAYFAEGTPQSAINLATRILGEGNVKIFPGSR
ncbi:DUF637 domain-containing protein [Trinickia diaoshuihuensis]|uniref:DUF637 domain-containing protein n=1 Tax=Trinickia diaoshuihuensis TaxID=2292265 RepID=UPI001F07F04B|nr:DUF637 domain-containing protein [Trinickia diaoshuihuensis]